MPEDIFKDFINFINKKDLNGLFSLMTPDHTFIDAQGNKFNGAEIMKESWAEYFAWFPDYTIEIELTLANENIIAGFGFASATFNGKNNEERNNYWRLPAAFKAETENNKIKSWQVYSDTKIVFEIVENNY